MEISKKLSIFDISDRTITFGMISLYFILKPFYFWESGLPQIADFILLILASYYLFRNRCHIRFYKESKSLVVIYGFLIAYIFVVNATWSLIIKNEPRFLISSAFYIYNFIVSILLIVLYCDYKEDLFKWVYFSVLASVIIQLLAFLLSGGYTGGRAEGFFNNPNQLGYHSLLTLAILLFTSQKVKINFTWFLVGIMSSVILCLASLSKAAIVAYAGMLIYFAFIRRKERVFALKILICMLLAILLLTIIYSFNFNSNGLLEGVSQRIGTIGQSDDDNLEARGYDRLVQYPQYLIFGAGEGAFSRFEGSKEFHSTLGNILMSYGIIGLGVFLASMFIVFKRNRWKDLYILAFIMAYGLTHNGIRNSLFWILIVLVSIGNINTVIIRNSISD